MKKRLLFGFGGVVLALSVLLVAWQGSFDDGRFDPASPRQTFIFWATSSLIFVLMVTLGFLLFRELVKLYIARQSNQEGSRIRTKLVLGALALTCVPVFCLVLFSFGVLSHSLNRWFTNPVNQQVDRFMYIAKLLDHEMQDEVNAQAALLAAQPETRQLLTGGARTPGFLEQFAKAQDAQFTAIFPAEGDVPVDSWAGTQAQAAPARSVKARAPVNAGGKTIGYAELVSPIPVDVEDQVSAIKRYNDQWTLLRDQQKHWKLFYTMLMALITLFVLFVATWIAFFLAKQISVPITALLDAAREVRKGNFKRVEVRAVDELASLVRGFNQMTEELEASGRELDRRRRFTEAILESIPTGVISIGADGGIKRVNQALSKIFAAETVAQATRLEDLFSREDTAEIRYLMKRARRTGTATRELELRTASRKLQIAITVSALEERLTSGFVVVLEDTSELLRAQKSAAWHDVARRVAHEIKNPLTPIALSAERIERQLDRLDLPPAADRILHECAATISKSVESVKTLVDEFSQFARFPAAQPVRSDLNQVVGDALAVFKGRLEGISIQTSFAPALPAVNLDPEQFQRVVVNLVDNAAEAMQESLVKRLYIATQPGGAETVELVIADSGCGISPDDKEKLFLPYFSTKNRGTGLGLAIVSHIVAEHNAQIRVEDNRPVGARFMVEIPALLEPDALESAVPMAPRPAAAKV
ncbi:MAG: HAMP domain-containing protein [Acidobacteriia bacterium]|nr:HAMP domain-containing protein [Terriglobia bacterium]